MDPIYLLIITALRWIYFLDPPRGLAFDAHLSCSRRRQLLKASIELGVIVRGVAANNLPKGSRQLYGTYLGLKRVPISLLRGHCMYYNDAWTPWASECM